MSSQKMKELSTNSFINEESIRIYFKDKEIKATKGGLK